MPERVQIEHIGHNRTELTWDNLSEAVRHGLYIVQSTPRRFLFRVGAGGVGSSEVSTLRGRTRIHTTGTAGGSNPTTRNRRWRIIWVALIPDCNAQATLLAETALMGHLGKLYPFVHKSIFYSERADEAVSDIVAAANSCQPILDEIIDFQVTARSKLPREMLDQSGLM